MPINHHIGNVNLHKNMQLTSEIIGIQVQAVYVDNQQLIVVPEAEAKVEWVWNK